MLLWLFPFLYFFYSSFHNLFILNWCIDGCSHFFSQTAFLSVTTYLSLMSTYSSRAEWITHATAVTWWLEGGRATWLPSTGSPRSSTLKPTSWSPSTTCVSSTPREWWQWHRSSGSTSMTTRVSSCTVSRCCTEPCSWSFCLITSSSAQA